MKYEKEKKEREARKSQTKIEIKEIMLRPKTGDHHRNIKVNNARGWLEDGKKVRVTIRFRGRELAHPELGRQILVRMANEMKDPAIVEREPKIEGRNMFMILTPRPAKVAQAPVKTGAQPQTVAAHPVAAPQKKEE